MRIRLIFIFGLLLSLLVNIVATWVDKAWSLSDPSRIEFTLLILIIVAAITTIFEVGLRIPGMLAFHRFWYSYYLMHSKELSQWSTMFAPLHLGKKTKYISSTEIYAEGGRRELVDFLWNSLTEGKSTKKHILILGEPGCGKSTALEKLALELASFTVKRLGYRTLMPILIRAGDIDTEKDMITVIKDAIGHWSFGRTRNILTDSKNTQTIIDKSQVVLLVDALDELSGEERDKVLNILKEASTTAGTENLPIIATCRTRQDPGHVLANFNTYVILELSDDSIVEFIDIYTERKGQQTETIYNSLKQGGFLEKSALGRNPFWLLQLIKVGAVEHTRSGILSITTKQSFQKELNKPRKVLRNWRQPPGNLKMQFLEDVECALAYLALKMDLKRFVQKDEADGIISTWLNDKSPQIRGRYLTPNQILEFASVVSLK